MRPKRRGRPPSMLPPIKLGVAPRDDGKPIVDNCLHFRYISANHPARESDIQSDMDRPAGRIMGRVRCPRAALQPAPGRRRASASQHYDWGARCIAGLGQAGAGNARNNRTRSSLPGWSERQGSSALAESQEAWPDAEPLRRKSLWQEPRWNADRCAHPALRMRGRARSARQKSLPSVGVSLPMFLSRSFFSSSCPGPTRAFVRQRGLRAFHRAFAGLASAWITGISE